MAFRYFAPWRRTWKNSRITSSLLLNRRKTRWWIKNLLYIHVPHLRNFAVVSKPAMALDENRKPLEASLGPECKKIRHIAQKLPQNRPQPLYKMIQSVSFTTLHAIVQESRFASIWWSDEEIGSILKWQLRSRQPSEPPKQRHKYPQFFLHLRLPSAFYPATCRWKRRTSLEILELLVFKNLDSGIVRLMKNSIWTLREFFAETCETKSVDLWCMILDACANLKSARSSGYFEPAFVRVAKLQEAKHFHTGTWRCRVMSTQRRKTAYLVQK